MNETTITTIHPFEKAGLGLAPFRFVSFRENLYNGRAGGTCDFCSTGIRYECVIRSSDGKTFVVGTDCVRKLDREDNALVSEVERAVLAAKAKQNEEKAAAKRAVECERREAKLEAERVANGGLTDFEVRQKEAAELEAKRAVEAAEQNGWLLSVLNQDPYPSDFVVSIKESLKRGKASDVIFGRAVAIVRDIYAKSFGRRGSKAYNAALDVFQDKFGGE